MDGSSAAIIAIPIVTTISLAVWLIMIYYADAHPRTQDRRPTRTADPEVSSGTPGNDIPSPRPSSDDAPVSDGERHGSMAVPVRHEPPAAGR
jgi:hypothetical protein